MKGLTCLFSIEKDIRLTIGNVANVGDYQFELSAITPIKGPNYLSQQATIHVIKDHKKITTLFPEKRFYTVKQVTMTEADIDPSLTRDIYVSMGDMLDKQTWAIRLHYKPFVRWIWLGGILMALGGIFAISDRRYRQKFKST